VSIHTQPNKIGPATNIPLNTNGIKDPSLRTFIARSGIQPTGDVFLIINANDIKAVNTIVLNVNRFF